MSRALAGPRAGAVGLLLLLAVPAAAAKLPVGAAPTTYTVKIAQMAFGPTPNGLRVGDAIEWVNADSFRHTATARNGAFDVDLPPRARARTVLRKAGEVSFYCRYHPGMTGKLAVAK